MPIEYVEIVLARIPAADKPRLFISADPNTCHETIQCVTWQTRGVAPMLGHVSFFNRLAGKAYEDKRQRGRYATESARLFGVPADQLAHREWLDETRGISSCAPAFP